MALELAQHTIASCGSIGSARCATSLSASRRCRQGRPGQHQAEGFVAVHANQNRARRRNIFSTSTPSMAASGCTGTPCQDVLLGQITIVQSRVQAHARRLQSCAGFALIFIATGNNAFASSTAWLSLRCNTALRHRDARLAQQALPSLAQRGRSRLAGWRVMRIGGDWRFVG